MGDSNPASSNSRLPTGQASARWPWYVAMVLVVGAVGPVVGAVRGAAEPRAGRWPAYGLGVLAAAACAAPLFAAVGWVFRREQAARADDPAAMAYRPAALPAVAFAGAVLQDLPASLTEAATWAFLACLAALVVGAVLLQRRVGRAWPWWVAVPVGFGIALVALLGAVGVVAVVAPSELRPG